jgi:Na+-driven multidrug efflux pump
LSQFFRRFSPRTLPALKVGVSQLILGISQLAPSILVRKFIPMAAPDDFNDSMAAYNAMIRVFIFTNAIIMAFTMGYVPPASYSYAKEDYRRWIRLSIHSFWLTGAWACLTCILTWTIPRQIGAIFAQGNGYLNWAEELIRTGNALNFVANARFLGVAFLQSLQRGFQATALSFCAHLLALVAFAVILFYTDRHNGPRVLWAYGLGYVFGLFMATAVLAKPVWELVKKAREKEAEEIALHEITDGLLTGEADEPVENPGTDGASKDP